jgi:hypothetical protein
MLTIEAPVQKARPAYSDDRHDVFGERVRQFLHKRMGWEDGRKLWNAGQKIHDLDQRTLFYSNLVKEVEKIHKGEPADLTNLKDMVAYKWRPVDIHTFVCDPYYLNKSKEVYPKVLAELEEMNNGHYQEVILTGGIGSAKTTSALYTIAYQLYLLSCMVSPNVAFGLDSVSEILFVFQSLNKKTSTNSFERFKGLVDGCKYFSEQFKYDKNLTSKLVFPNRIEVVPVSGAETAVIGQNVIGGLIDELNYMSIVQNSKQSVDAGQYDQAVALYNSIARRRKSRYSKAGKMPGILCLVSSKRYPGQFTDKKEEERAKEIARTGKSTIYLYDYRVWEVKPEGSFSPDRFYVFAGDESRKPRILKPDEKVADEDRKLVHAIPTDFYGEFEEDIINALREIAGVSTLARHPYFVNVEAITDSFGKFPSIFSRDAVDFVETKLKIIPSAFYRPELPRFVHIDLAISGDSCGLAIGCCTGFKTMKSLGFGDNEAEMMPVIRYDGILEVKPPKGGEILFYKVRHILSKLRDLGMNVRWVSFDSFQSKDSMQLLRQQGFVVGEISMDVNSHGYDCLKSAIYTGRVMAPEHLVARKELVGLEKDTKTGKIDHPATGSKDCSDAMAGVAYGLTSRREIWGMFSIPIVQIPSNVDSMSKKMNEEPGQPARDPEPVEA